MVAPQVLLENSLFLLSAYACMEVFNCMQSTLFPVTTEISRVTNEASKIPRSSCCGAKKLAVSLEH